ncbi:MAG: arylsulfotransferase family protein [Candidatus Electryonea clarkiae]|nr:arylsulfotransferase family protein [Candidatus Electryonea clarkiae]MDP8287790.1 arylsulfotransferase family protein [Candidatus Electryonea clarkiae]
MDKINIAAGIWIIMIGMLCVVFPVAALDVALPSQFFDYNIDVNNNPAEGYNYMAPGSRTPARLPYHYLVIMDNEGVIKYFKKSKLGSYYLDFVPFPDLRLIAYADMARDLYYFYIMDLTYTIIDSVHTTENYSMDLHELLILGEGENRRYWIIGNDNRAIDMSEIVEDGDPEAIIRGMVVQELDSEQDVVWEWNSLDHLDEIPITDSMSDLTSDYIDYLHTNAIELDFDGNILLSQRSINAVTKIDYESHEVIWTWGGGPGNMFDFINDFEEDSAFYMQHDIRRLENGNISIFDNGNFHSPRRSYAKVYDLDEENLTATLVWSHSQDPLSYSGSRGSHRIIDNGNHLIGWGTGTTDIFTTEVSNDGTVEWQISFDETPDSNSVYDYRAYRSTMIGTAAVPYVCEESDEEEITLYCNWFGHEDEVMSYNVYLDDISEPVDFFANTETGIYEITGLTSEIDYHVRIKAVGDGGAEISDYSNDIIVRFESEIVEDESSSGSMDFVLDQNYPNPFNNNTIIQYYIPESVQVSLRVYNIKGQEITTLLNGKQSAGTNSVVFDASGLANGIYFYKLYSPIFNSTGKMLLVK